jgi:hypothetical protein
VKSTVDTVAPVAQQVVDQAQATVSTTTTTVARTVADSTAVIIPAASKPTTAPSSPAKASHSSAPIATADVKVPAAATGTTRTLTTDTVATPVIEHASAPTLASAPSTSGLASAAPRTGPTAWPVPTRTPSIVLGAPEAPPLELHPLSAATVEASTAATAPRTPLGDARTPAEFPPRPQWPLSQPGGASGIGAAGAALFLAFLAFLCLAWPSVGRSLRPESVVAPRPGFNLILERPG